MKNKRDKKPLILITNDDGYLAKGMNTLIQYIRKLGDVIVVAPDSPRSGQANAITVNVPTRIENVVNEEGYLLYKCTGTPVDCVKLAFNKICTRRPDLILSGINHGYNGSISILYSGTMGAALEGAVLGVPSIGFSLNDFAKDADFEPSMPIITSMVLTVLEKGMSMHTCLNVNFPKGEIKGIKICRQSKGYWKEEFDQRKDPFGKDYYWLTGSFENEEKEAVDTDEWALANQYVSVVPCQVDMTAYHVLADLKSWEREF